MSQTNPIKEIPLFPLPIVLLPGEVLPLHIFEERYKAMLADVRAGEGSFGLVYFEPADEALVRPSEAAVRPTAGAFGCLAAIRDVAMLEDGRSNILTVGVRRFHLLDYVDSDRPYLVGDVQFFDDEEDASEEVEKLADEVFELFKRTAKAAY